MKKILFALASLCSLVLASGAPPVMAQASTGTKLISSVLSSAK